MPDIRLHDTLPGELVALEPRDPGKVGIYACGPTVYNRIHVGNARPFVVFSLLKRFLEHEGYEATLVANVTDVNDKIYDAARPRGRQSHELAREMTAHYVADTDLLELGRPDHEPLASESMDGIVALIQALLDNGSAYAVEGDVYFRVRSDPKYGSLSRRDVDQMDQGEGVEGSDRKEDPLDFALWKAEKAGEDTSLGRALGPRASGLAHRVLGDGRGAAGRRASTSTAAATTSSSPTTRTRRRRRAWRAGPSSRGSGCTTGCSRWARRRWPSRSATSRCCTRWSSAGAATRS